jgi:hypothetical protein
MVAVQAFGSELNVAFRVSGWTLGQAGALVDTRIPDTGSENASAPCSTKLKPEEVIP